MKKSLVTLAMLSMTALLFTACNKGEEKTEESTTPAVEESAVVPEVSVEAPAVEVEAAPEAAVEATTESAPTETKSE